MQWFKLLLLDDQDLPEDVRNSHQIQRARELLQNAGKTATEAVADYLRFLWEHAISKIRETLGRTVLSGTPFRVVITVPAVWNHKAVRKMRQAALDAGILEPRLCSNTTLHFVSEPEAAALATLRDMKVAQFEVCPSFADNHKYVNLCPERRLYCCLRCRRRDGGKCHSQFHRT